MKKIDRKNLPFRLPVYETLVAYLMLDRFPVRGWVWGAVGTIFVALWISILHELATSEEVDIFNPHK